MQVMPQSSQTAVACYAEHDAAGELISPLAHHRMAKEIRHGY
jgi:hypothetical protein